MPGDQTTSANRMREGRTRTAASAVARKEIWVRMSDVVIVGAGLAGLACAQDLTRAGVDCRVVEASDAVGGRVRTDVVDGFLLDRGFQILLTAYPEVGRRLDVDALDLQYFEPGATVRLHGRFRRVADPLRRPAQIPQTLTAPIGTLADKVRLLRLILDVRSHSVQTLLRRYDMTTADRLARAGFSEQMIESFWRPLFSGIQLDPELEVSSRRFDTILRMLAIGSTAVPRIGMGTIPEQLRASLPDDTVRCGARVRRVDGSYVILDDGARLDARAVVVATEGPTAHQLLGHRVPDPGSRAAACCWFSASQAPLLGPVVILDGESSGPARNLAVMSEVSSSYAPAGRALVAAAVPGPGRLGPKPHNPRARAACSMVRFDRCRVGTLANRRHRPWTACPAPSAASQADGGARRRDVRVRRPPRHRVDSGSHVQRRTGRHLGHEIPP